MANGFPTAIATATNTCLIFVAFRALLPPTRSRIEDHLVLYSGLLIGPLSIMSSVSSAYPSDTQPLNALSFAAVDSS
jgi:hypothetical protein